MYKGKIWLLSFAVYSSISIKAQQVIMEKPLPGAVEIVGPGRNATICYDPADFSLAARSASWLQQDIEKVTGKKIALATTLPSSANTIIVIGSLEKSSMIQQLVRQNKLSIDKVKNKWDAYLV